MALEFRSTLGASIAKDEGIESFFQAEAMSFIFNNYVSFHTDSINDDGTLGVNNTLSFSVTVPITEDLAQITSVRKAMKMFNLEVGGLLSISMLLYSRNVVQHFIRKELNIKEMLDTSKNGTIHPSRFLICPLLVKAINHVQSDMNTNAIQVALMLLLLLYSLWLVVPPCSRITLPTSFPVAPIEGLFTFLGHSDHGGLHIDPSFQWSVDPVSPFWGIIFLVLDSKASSLLSN
jgi:hypothetical protein